MQAEISTGSPEVYMAREAFFFENFFCIFLLLPQLQFADAELVS